MAVVCETNAGWLLDELSLIKGWYEAMGEPPTCEGQENTRTVYRMKDELFQLVRPYFSLNLSATSNQNTAAPSDRQDNAPPAACKPVRKKRKRANALNQGELDALEYHQKISDLILKGSQVLIQEGLKNGLLRAYTQNEEENCKVISEVCVRSSNLAELCNMTKELSTLGVYEHTVNIIGSDQQSLESMDWLSHITENRSEWPQVIQLMGEKYLIPPKTSFLLSDVSCMEPLLNYKKYGIIVIDPPWENKSVKRSKRYNYLSTLEIKQLPIPDLAAQNCLVITWVTNRQKHLRFVKEELYPHWSVRTLAEWHWVKITQSGEFVFPMESAHKKPYEILVLGCLIDDMDSTAREPDFNTSPIPQHKIIVSVPCNLHSHKPPLFEILKKYVKPDVERLELFARNLQPGWTSWGNEVLKFQHLDYFIPFETDK
ncbi:N(6)-adenine-specific methyltransferase METTL4 isoform X1 [Rana temporaria]|uniref:N(6)-adenine-specific methyltransferase METTL4 isoform X1 n=1 Tax=Rana temporaria TaxID=8407 RepID=UPI001AADD081|nr:N(6)-adenine-specific methyltransferase METTL4 isoform X1 [Rana temporaria]